MTDAPTTVFLFHPNYQESRVNKALATAAQQLSNVQVRDMYSLYPDGKIDVAVEQSIMATAHRLVLQFPLYWYSCPPLAKQWLDSVLTYGWAYGSTGKALHGKELSLAVTAGAAGYNHDQVGYTMHELLRPFQATSNLIGTTFLTPFIIEGVLNSTDKQLGEYAKDYEHYLTSSPQQLAPYA